MWFLRLEKNKNDKKFQKFENKLQVAWTAKICDNKSWKLIHVQKTFSNPNVVYIQTLTEIFIRLKNLNNENMNKCEKIEKEASFVKKKCWSSWCWNFEN